jgi:hypothetical protein
MGAFTENVIGVLFFLQEFGKMLLKKFAYINRYIAIVQLKNIKMKLSEIKKYLADAESVNFQLENGTMVPEHFHVTEVGIITKDFIDCGGMVRHEKTANFQLWDANDYEHRLKAGKLLNIIALSEKVLDMEDLDIEVEYQAETIGKYDLGFDGKNFLLLAKQTACLAQDKCGIPTSAKKKVVLSDLGNVTSCCSTESNCCK